MFDRDVRFSKIDLSSAAHFAEPEASFAALRARGTLSAVRLPFIGDTWLTTSYAASVEMLKTPDLFARQPERAGLRDTAQFRWWMPKTLHRLADNMIARDDPDHRRLRGIVDHAFARRDIASMEQTLIDLARQLLETIKPGQTCDITDAYTREIPFRAICELLGLSKEDSQRARRMTKGLGRITGPVSFLTAMPGLAAFRRCLEKKFRARNTPPDQGIIGLLHSREVRQTLSENELVAMIFLLFVGGHETTVHLINAAIVMLAENPQIKQKILNDWSLLPLFLEEVLRHFAPIQMTKPRFVTEDTTLHGQVLRRGEQIAAHIGCANRDPLKHSDPDIFDPTRKPNTHLGFSTGPHFCLGLMLARLEARIAVQTLFTQFPNLERTAAKLDWRPRLGMRALRTLPVVLR